MNEPRFYHADGTVPATPATPLAPAAAPPPATALAAPAAVPAAGGFDQAALTAALSAAFAPISTQLSAISTQLSALPTPQAAAPPTTGPITGVIQNTLATGQPAGPPAPTYEQSELAEFTRRPGAVLAMALQQQARAAHLANKFQIFESPVARCKHMFGESHPVTMALSQMFSGVSNYGQYQNYTLAGQNSRDAAVGGVLVRSLMGDFINILTERAVVRGSGPRVVSNPSGVMEMPGASGSTSVAYIGEGEPAALSEMTFKKNLLLSRKLAGKVAWTWEALHRPVYDLFAIVIDNLINQMALKEDLAFLRSDGSDGEPVGIFNQLAAANRVTCQPGWAAADANVQITKARTDRQAMIQKLRDNFLYNDGSGVFFMPPAPWGWIERASNTFGMLGFPEAAQMKWGSSPVKETSLLRSNLGGSGILSEVLYVQMSQVIIADESELRTHTSDSFTILHNGVYRTAADLDMTVTQVTASHDIGLMRDIAASSTSDCPYR